MTLRDDSEGGRCLRVTAALGGPKACGRKGSAGLAELEKPVCKGFDQFAMGKL